MDRETRRWVDGFRRHEAGPLENALVDDLVGGELDRQEFLRRGALLGLSVGAMGGLLSLVGEAPAATRAMAAARKGGTLRVAISKPVGTPEPSKAADVGGLGVISIVGEYLTFSDTKLRLQPWLATSWKPNGDASVWTFQIRKGVKFHTGQTMTADDVVATFKVLTGKESAAASVFRGILAPAGVMKTGPFTVQFRLEQPTGGFPYLVSQTTYQAPILPKSLAPGSWIASKAPGTGPYRLQSYVEGRSATFVRNTGYWGTPPALDQVRLSFFETTAPQVLALRAGQVDLVQQLSAIEAAPFTRSSKFQVWDAPTANHRQFGLRTDREPFRDPRVRRAIALTLGRPELVQKLFTGHATVGNDSPFWKVYPSTAQTKQRVKNIQLAKALLAAAGKSGLEFTITTWRNLEIPDYAQIIQSSAKEAGVDVKLEILTSGEYYGGADPYELTTPWLNRPATITDYGHRAIPNVYLTAALATGGEWNASKYANPQFDAAMRSYIGASDVATQRRHSRTMQGLLLRDTPVVFAYFFNYTAAGSARVKGYVPEGLGAIGLRGVSLG